jgi:dTDP-4-dehydrorhamnose reductase
MRILILGGDGMLGHRLLRDLGMRHDVRATLRRDAEAYAGQPLFSAERCFFGIDARHTEPLLGVAAQFRPDAIVNCVGIVKQRDEAKAALPSIEINALLPHRLALIARSLGATLVHLSTDCVFSGRRGHYTESDISDAEDLYGRSKYLGEVGGPGCITLRTSIIGLELSRKAGLIEWFLSQRGKAICGYRGAVYTGFTTAEMARIIERVLTARPQASGVYQVSSAPISKFELLSRLNEACGLGVRIAPDDAFQCDRSLDSSRFRAEFSYSPPSWEAMLAELATEIRASRA